MTKEDYYLCSNKFNNWYIHASVAAFFFTKIYMTGFILSFEFYFNNTKNIEMQAANENKYT